MNQDGEKTRVTRNRFLMRVIFSTVGRWAGYGMIDMILRKLRKMVDWCDLRMKDVQYGCFYGTVGYCRLWLFV